MSKQYQFLDGYGEVHGPFSVHQMRVWMKAGYFSASLLVCKHSVAASAAEADQQQQREERKRQRRKRAAEPSADNENPCNDGSGDGGVPGGSVESTAGFVSVLTLPELASVLPDHLRPTPTASTSVSGNKKNGGACVDNGETAQSNGDGNPTPTVSEPLSTKEAAVPQPQDDNSLAGAATKWFYQDAEGVVRGPFPFAQMDGWLRAGAFPPSLPVQQAAGPGSLAPVPGEPWHPVITVPAFINSRPPVRSNAIDYEEYKAGASFDGRGKFTGTSGLSRWEQSGMKNDFYSRQLQSYMDSEGYNEARRKAKAQRQVKVLDHQAAGCAGLDDKTHDFVVGFTRALLSGNRVDELEQENALLRAELDRERAERARQQQRPSSPPPSEEPALPAHWDQGLDDLAFDSMRLSNALGSMAEAREQFVQNTADVRADMDEVQRELDAAAESVVVAVGVERPSATGIDGDLVSAGESDADDEVDFMLEISALQLYQACVNASELKTIAPLLDGSDRHSLLVYVGAHGRTTLHEAAAHCSADVVQLLLSPASTASLLNLRDDEGNTPLHVCLEATGNSKSPYECRKVAQILLDAGADVNAVNGLGRTPLIVAALADCTACVEFLCARGADVHSVDSGGRTPLHSACAAPRSIDGGIIRHRLLSCATLLANGAKLTLDNAGALPSDLLPKMELDQPPDDAFRCLMLLKQFVRSPPQHALALRALTLCRLLVGSSSSPFLQLPWTAIEKILVPLLCPIERMAYPLTTAKNFTFPPLCRSLFGPTHVKRIFEFSQQRPQLDPTAVAAAKVDFNDLAQKLLTL